MNDKEYAAWKTVTESSHFRWVEDEIYRLNGRGAFYYSGGEDGVYLRIDKDGLLTAGQYEGAVPHIGEATFTEQAQRQYETYGAAFTAALEAGGKQFLVDMLTAPEQAQTQQHSQNIYSGADFQCDQTEGYPTVLCWDLDNETAWLEPAPAYDDDSPEAAQCRELCEEWGARPCDSWQDYNDLLESIGEEAYENAVFQGEDEDFDMSMQ